MLKLDTRTCISISAVNADLRVSWCELSALVRSDDSCFLVFRCCNFGAICMDGSGGVDSEKYFACHDNSFADEGAVDSGEEGATIVEPVLSLTVDVDDHCCVVGPNIEKLFDTCCCESGERVEEATLVYVDATE